MISQQKLDFCIDNGFNALLIGRHGTGKTSCVRQAFDRHGLKSLYFSVATMDPWVDFVGVPSPTKDENGVEYLDLIRPKAFAYDEVEAIFLDEYNRGSDKVRNAALELIQFKSINGRKFKNLKVVWAAINPDDDITCYDVQKLDWAQKDRFHIHIYVPYVLDRTYFAAKYGDVMTDRVEAWWNGLSDEVRYTISPRRVDFALEVYLKGGSLRDVIPEAGNVTHLINTLTEDAIEIRLEAIMKSGDTQAARNLMKNDTEYTEAMKWVLKDSDRVNFFLPLVNDEKLSGLFSAKAEEDDVVKTICQSFNTNDKNPLTERIIANYKDPKYRQKFGNALPNANSVLFGTKVNEVQEFRIDKDCKEGFLQDINEFNKQDTTLHQVKEKWEYIKKTMGSKGHGKNGDAGIVLFFIGKIFRTINNWEIIKAEFPDIMSVTNFCLKTQNKDVRSDEVFKALGIRFQSLKMEQYCWIPGV